MVVITIDILSFITRIIGTTHFPSAVSYTTGVFTLWAPSRLSSKVYLTKDGVFPKTGRSWKGKVYANAIPSPVLLDCAARHQACTYIFYTVRTSKQDCLRFNKTAIAIGRVTCCRRPSLQTTTWGRHLISISAIIVIKWQPRILRHLCILLYLMLTSYVRMSCVLRTGLSYF